MRWAIGFMLGMIWMGLNFYLIKKILEIALLKRQKKSLGAMLMIKFPVLYLGGFAVLSTNFFPTKSILAGLAIPLIIIGIRRIWLSLIIAYRSSRT